MLNLQCVLGTFGLTGLKNSEVKREGRDFGCVLRVVLKWNSRTI